MKVNLKKIIEFLMILFLFEPIVFVKFKVVNYIYILGAVVSLIYIVVLKLAKKETKINLFTLILILYRVVLVINTIIFKGDILKTGYQTIVLVSLFLYAEYFYNQNKMEVFINILHKIFFVYLLINLFSCIKFPNGIINGLYFLGIRTRFTEYSIILLLLSLIKHQKDNNKMSLIIDILLAVANIMIVSVSTGILGLMIILLLYIVLRKIKYFNYKVLFWIGIILTIGIVFFGIQSKFAFIIEEVLHKEISLTGRTEIWNNSFEHVFDSLILTGHGYSNDGNFVPYYGGKWQAHNQLLQSLYETGIFGSILFYWLFYKSLKKLNQESIEKKYKIITGSVLFAFIIMMITEIYGYYPPFYISLVIAYYGDNISTYFFREKIEGKIKK